MSRTAWTVQEDLHTSAVHAWPGRLEGLTHREGQIVSLITRGFSNQQIADREFLSINSVKSYIKTSYQKMGVTTRSHAVLWGVEHGLHPDFVRRDSTQQL